MASLSPRDIKKEFPIFRHHPNLVYLDTAATALTPRAVIDKITEYYEQYSANVAARGVYRLSERASQEFEETRDVVRELVNAPDRREIVFTRGTTESINLITATRGQQIVTKGDAIAVTTMEHHANFVPWQRLAKEKGATFSMIDVNDDGRITEEALKKTITKKTKIFALTHISNVLGTINPVEEMCKVARAINPDIIIVVDAAQSVAHVPVDVQKFGCDFLVFSGHKICGPKGVGVLWGKYAHLERMPPYQTGGAMVRSVCSTHTTFQDPPHKFEAGTPAVADVIALKVAIRYVQKIGFAAIRTHEKKLLTYAVRKLRETFGDDLKIVGPQNITDHDGLLSFTFKNYHPHDIAHLLDEYAFICIRAGHHCAMPLHAEKLCVTATARASFYVYNEERDVDKLVKGLKKVDKILS